MNGYISLTLLVKKAQPFDMFPQTSHIECEVGLEIKANL